MKRDQHKDSWLRVKSAKSVKSAKRKTECPDTLLRHCLGAGDFASVLFSVVEGRASTTKTQLTLGDVNAALTKIHNAPDAMDRGNRETGL